VAPDDIPDRADATGSRDTNTIQLARAIDAALFERTGRHAHLILCQLHRDKLDCNRSLGAAQDGHPETEAAWFEYHAFIDAAKRTAIAQYGRGLYIDLHGLAASRDKNELGYLLYPAQLFEPDERLDHPGYARRSSMRTLAGEHGGGVVELIRGLSSLGAFLQAGGFDAVPSPAFPDPGYDDDGEPIHYFNGGYNTVRHGSQGGGAIDGLQIETIWAGVRDTAASRAEFGAALADAILEWVPTWLDLDLEARNFVRLGPVHGWASERGATASVTVRRTGDLSVPLTVGLAWDGPAGPGVDVVEPPTSVEFAAGQDEVELEITAIADQEAEGPETLTLRLLPGDGYNRQSDASIRVIRVVDADRVGLLLSGVEPDDALPEAGAASFLELRRDGCGLPLDVDLDLGGEASEDDVRVDGAPPGELTIRFEGDDASILLELAAVEDGLLEGVETLELTFTPAGDDPTDPTATAARLRLIDGDQDPDLLAFFDGRTDGPLLVEAGEEPLRAELLPSAADGPQPEEGGPAGVFLTFDGEDDVVLLDDLDYGGPFTVAFAFRASDDLPDGFRYLYGHGNVNQANHLNVYLTTAGTLRTSLRGSGDASDYDALDVPGSFRDGAWHHCAVVVIPGDPSSAVVYVDGVEAASAARGGPGFDPPHPIFLGSRWDLNPSRDFEGDLDEIVLLARAITADEAAALSEPFLAR
jgi:hypothetical protein